MVLTADTVRSRTLESVRLEPINGLLRLTFTAMATHCQVLLATHDRRLAKQYVDELIDWIIEFETKYSRFLDTSVISQLNSQAGLYWQSIDPETETIFRLCDELYFLTEKTLDPSSLPFTHIWNWKAANPIIPDARTIRNARSRVGWKKIHRRPGQIFLPKKGMGIDLGGMGKEYAVDQAIQLGHELGLRDLLVDFGQDVRAIGAPPGRPVWHIGLEHPDFPGVCDRGIAIDHMGIASSGNYLRHFKKSGRTYGHIIDPRTGEPVANEVRSATVISPSCVLSGALSTAAVILGPDKGLELIERTFNAEGMIRTDQQTYQSRGFAAYVTP